MTSCSIWRSLLSPHELLKLPPLYRAEQPPCRAALVAVVLPHHDSTSLSDIAIAVASHPTEGVNDGIKVIVQ